MNDDSHINRSLRHEIEARLDTGKAIVLTGARQVGKTTLIKQIIDEATTLSLNGDDPGIRARLANATAANLQRIIGSFETVYIDEAQKIEGIGNTLKMITDQFPQVQLIVTGSSAFDLGNLSNESLAGRKWEFTLLPVTWQEYEQNVGHLNALENLEKRVLFGFYPEVITHAPDEVELLNELTNSYLYRDIFSLGNVRRPELLENLVKALALQTGSEVSYNELSQLLHSDIDTIKRYMRLLEQSYVIFRLPSFSRNVRNEIKKNRKIFFYDTGIRNAVIGNFESLELRADKGALWENFIIAERIKRSMYLRRGIQSFFWRTKQQQEVDLIETEAGQMRSFEIKWLARKKPRLPLTFSRNYKSEFEVIDSTNFHHHLAI